jgi:hypothetical protein
MGIGNPFAGNPVESSSSGHRDALEELGTRAGRCSARGSQDAADLAKKQPRLSPNALCSKNGGLR